MRLSSWRNFNAMSEKLEWTISDAEKANYELQRYWEKEKMENMRMSSLKCISELKTPPVLIQGIRKDWKEESQMIRESQANWIYCGMPGDGLWTKQERQNPYGKNHILSSSLNQFKLERREGLGMLFWELWHHLGTDSWSSASREILIHGRTPQCILRRMNLRMSGRMSSKAENGYSNYHE